MSLHSPNSVLWTLATVSDAVITTKGLGNSNINSQTHNHRTPRKSCRTTHQIGDLTLSLFLTAKKTVGKPGKGHGVKISI